MDEKYDKNVDALMKEHAEERKVNTIAAACHSVARAYAIGGGLMDSMQWEVAPHMVRADTIEAVKLIMEGGGEEDLYYRRPRKVTAQDAASTDYSVTKTIGNSELEEPHKALKVGDTLPYSQLPAEDHVKLTLFVETVKTMQRAMTPPVNVDRRAPSKR